MKETNTINKILGTLKSKKDKLSSFLLSFLNKFKSVKFLIILVFLTFLINSFIVFRINYTENYAVTYRYERPTVLLGNENYLELYRFHDYIQFKDKSVNSVMAANLETKSKVNIDPILNISSSSEEIALGSTADITTKLNRIDANNFEMIRTIKFRNNQQLQDIESVYMELILGGNNIKVVDNKIIYKRCEVKMNYSDALYANYKDAEKVITFSTLRNNNSEITFKITFNLNCE